MRATGRDRVAKRELGNAIFPISLSLRLPNERYGFRVVTNDGRAETRPPLDTPRLARTLDSLVRVSRRVGKRPEDSSQTGTADGADRREANDRRGHH